jgi:ComF family protein
MKFSRARAAANIVGQLTVEALPYLQAEYVVVPVPTAAKRVRQRGYDHAALIARELARHEGLTMHMLLKRLGNARQVGASREVRLTQLQGAFYVPRPERVHGKDILLVDDILTTGGSVEQAARALRQAGARSVAAVIFAKKQ